VRPSERAHHLRATADELTERLLAAAAGTTPALASAGAADEALGIGSRLLVERTEWAVTTGHVECGVLLERLRRRATRSGSVLAQGLLSRCEALAAPPSERVHALEAVVEQLESCGQVLKGARARLLLGEWLEGQGAGRGRAQLDAALEVFVGAGADAFAARARRAQLQQQAAAGPVAGGGTAAAAPPAVAAGPLAEVVLTAREHHITALVVEGRSNPEIADELGISRRTVEYHLQKVFRKLGVESRHTLRALAGAGGVPTDEDPRTA
jgi:DNA-binding CsgD family transcriptional regulator